MRARRSAGGAAASAPVTSASAPSRAQSPGKTCIGSLHPNASTLITTNSTQASTSPTGSAASAVNPASASARHSSIQASRARPSPIAQTGASCASRIPDSVTRLARSAIPATARVSTLSACVTVKVRSKMRREKRLASA